MSYCINCGAEIKKQSAKFCFKCGTRIEIEETTSLNSPEIENKPRLTDIKGEEKSSSNSADGKIYSSSKTEIINNSSSDYLSTKAGKGNNSSERTLITEIVKTENSNISIHELGKFFEDMVENILKYQNYSTQRDIRLNGLKGKSEIDILGTRNIKGSEEKIAVECKNYESKVSVSAMRDFHEKLNDLQIKNGLFAVYKGFSADAFKWGQGCGLELWDCETVKQKYYEMQVGRLKVGDVAKFEYCLPITVNSEQATKLGFANKDLVDVVETKLIWKPFYKISYKVNCTRTDPSKQNHSIDDSGNRIVDAMSEFKKAPKSSVENMMKTVGFIDQSEEERRIDREDEIFLKLFEQEPVKNFSLSQSGDYKIIKLKPVVSESAARERVVNSVIENNTRIASWWRKNETILDAKNFEVAPNSKDVKITNVKLIFLPKWEIEFKSKDYKYIRIISANNGATIFDNVTYCNEHWNLGFLQKKNIAVCDICGQALCKEHMAKCPICGSWRCKAHAKQCSECKLMFCPEHVNGKCSECKGSICESCSSICSICGETHCKTHMTKCDKCNKRVCSSCTTKEGSLFSKKTICRECKHVNS